MSTAYSRLILFNATLFLSKSGANFSSQKSSFSFKTPAIAPFPLDHQARCFMLWLDHADLAFARTDFGSVAGVI